VGNAEYAAPEILLGARATIESDVYSLGVLLFHLLTGKFPVPGESLEAIKAAHQRSEARAICVPPCRLRLSKQSIARWRQRPVAGSLRGCLCGGARVSRGLSGPAMLVRPDPVRIGPAVVFISSMPTRSAQCSRKPDVDDRQPSMELLELARDGSSEALDRLLSRYLRPLSAGRTIACLLGADAR
jgi:serine/threonine protein kinase